MIDVHWILKELKEDRQLFHSEADFQHEFAWKIHELYEDIGVRLEYPVSIEGRRRSLDVWLKNKKKMGIELKYKTRFFKGRDKQEEKFQLRNQHARDHGRYDFLKDIQRLETLKRHSQIETGYAILLTNDYGYWNQPENTNTIDREFHVSEGRETTLCMTWHNAGHGTVQGRSNPIELDHKYNLTWKEYSQVDGEGRGEFRYLLVTV